MEYEYDEGLFREWLLADYESMTQYQDRKRYNLIFIKCVLTWSEEYGKEFLINEYKRMSKHWYWGAKEIAEENLQKL